MFTLLGFPLQPKQMGASPRNPLQSELGLYLADNRIFTSLGCRLVGSWRSMHVAEQQPPKSRPSAVCLTALNHFCPLPDSQPPNWWALMAAQGKESSRGRAEKYTTRGESWELSGPCYSQGQDQDLPPESAKQADWTIFVYPLTLTNQILRLLFQLLKGSVKGKQAQISR